MIYVDSMDFLIKNGSGVGYRDFPEATVMAQKTALKGIYNSFKAVYNVVPFLLNYCSYSFFRFGFIGNQPFSTRSRCSKTSFMVQKEENEKTPNRVDSRI